jgi:hypothetical protein
MKDLFVMVALSFAEGVAVDAKALADEMKALGLDQNQKSTEGHPVVFPQYAFGGCVPSEDRTETHRKIHRGLNGILKKLALHGKFLIVVAPDVDWSCCHF